MPPPRRGHHGLAAEEVAGLEGGTRRPWAAAFQRLRHVGRVHEAEAQRTRQKPWPSACTCTRCSGGTHGTSLKDHRQDDIALVQHLVVLQVVQQRLRHRGGSATAYTAVRAGAGPVGRVQAVDEGLQRARRCGCPPAAAHGRVPRWLISRTAAAPAPAGTSRRRRTWRRRPPPAAASMPRKKTVAPIASGAGSRQAWRTTK
jgi:hypothetical protein